MLDVVGAGPLMSPWFGVWDLVMDSPEASIALIAVLFTMATAGIALAAFGLAQPETQHEGTPIVVRRESPTRRACRRR
jgi:hypothetical protein